MQPKTHRGRLNAKGFRFALVVSRWNDFLTSRLAQGAIEVLESYGVTDGDVEIFMTPGAFELPLTAKKVALQGRFDAVIALGVVIRGETPHFDYVAGEAAKGIAAVGLETGVPVSFGLVTADNLEQAINRSGVKAGNKGAEAAQAAVEMVELFRQIATHDTQNKEGSNKAFSNVV